jgi:hypothetical protein
LEGKIALHKQDKLSARGFNPREHARAYLINSTKNPGIVLRRRDIDVTINEALCCVACCEISCEYAMNSDFCRVIREIRSCYSGNYFNIQHFRILQLRVIGNFPNIFATNNAILRFS